MNPPNSGRGAPIDGADNGAANGVANGANDRANEADGQLQLSRAGADLVPYPDGDPQQLSWATYALCYGWPGKNVIDKAIAKATAQAHGLLDLYVKIDYFNTHQHEFMHLQVQGPPGPSDDLASEAVFLTELKILLSIETLHCIGGITWNTDGRHILRTRVQDGSEWVLYARVPKIATPELCEIYQRYLNVLERCNSKEGKDFNRLVEGCMSQSTANRSPQSRPAWLLTMSMKGTGNWVKSRGSNGRRSHILWDKLFPNLLLSTFHGPKMVWEATKRVLGPEVITQFRRRYLDLSENLPTPTKEMLDHIPTAVYLFKAITELSLSSLFPSEGPGTAQPESTAAESNEPEINLSVIREPVVASMAGEVGQPKANEPETNLSEINEVAGEPMAGETTAGQIVKTETVEHEAEPEISTALLYPNRVSPLPTSAYVPAEVAEVAEVDQPVATLPEAELVLTGPATGVPPSPSSPQVSPACLTPSPTTRSSRGQCFTWPRRKRVRVNGVRGPRVCVTPVHGGVPVSDELVSYEPVSDETWSGEAQAPELSANEPAADSQAFETQAAEPSADSQAAEAQVDEPSPESQADEPAATHPPTVIIVDTRRVPGDVVIIVR